MNRADMVIPRWVRSAGIVFASAVVAFSLYLLTNALSGLDAGHVMRAIRGVQSRKLWLSVGLTGISFLALGTYDILAVGIVARRKIPGVRAWFAGAAANAVSNTLGFHVLTATAVRYRILTRSGLRGPDIVGVTALSWTALAFGFAAFFSLALLFAPAIGPWPRIGGFALLCTLLLIAGWLGPGRTVVVKSSVLVLPPGRLALAQMLLGGVEMAAAIGALYILMPNSAPIAFPAFSALYIGAVLLGIASHAPGGLGVFEATMLALAPGESRAAILAALLLYRLIYNLCPFALAVLALLGDEIRAAISLNADSA